MSTSERHRQEWDRRGRLVQRIEALFLEEDVANEPPALDEEDRKALRVTLRIASESDDVFRRVALGRGLIRRTERVDHLCDSILSGMDFFADVKQTAEIVQGISLPPRGRRGPLARLLAEHHRLFQRLQEPRLGLPKRLSVVLELIQIELIFFGHVW